jgi:Glycosyl transferase family 11
MVINNYKGGQLANRILSFAHLLANSIGHQYKLYNPEFDEYNPYFEGSSKNHFNNYPVSVTLFRNHFADRAFSRLFRLWADITHKLFTRTPFYVLYRIFKSHDKRNIVFDLNDAAFVKDARTKTVITEGWLFRDYDNFNKYENEIRQFFAPVEKYKSEVNKIMEGLRQQADMVIGVHIRRGDYIRYAAGRWFFDDAVYAGKMQQVQNKMSASGKRCIFLICSNDKIDPANFPPELKLYTGNRHFIVDLYCLAACDGIIGPPSTFSIWASFYGKIPLAQINSKDDTIELGEYVNLC